ncbi:MAG: hypothetical protein JSV11_02315 [Nitrospiraceae bacterium]|nr:MAG: hypothetical protein JSV11_02315 [Nitrospiraceae bacterium]
MKKASLLFFVFIFILAGCSGKDKVKPSEDSVLTRNTLRVLETIKKAYETKDSITLQKNIDTALYDEVAKELIFDKADLSLSTPRMVRIGKSDIKVLQNWQCEWMLGSRVMKDRGVGTLVFDKETLKLVAAEGDSPFSLPLIK